MGLFDSTGDGSSDDEVVINAPEEDSGTRESRLKSEVETNIAGTSNDDSIDLGDIHRQNEKIIDLLEELVDDKSSSSKGSHRVTDAGSSRTTDTSSSRSTGSSRVTGSSSRSKKDDDDGLEGGMDELL